MIDAAIIGWAERWGGSTGENEAGKWQADWKRRPALTGWPHLQREAAKLIPGYSTEAAAAEFADDLPPIEVPPIRGKSMRDRFIFPTDCEAGERRGYVIKHLIAPGDVGALIGAPGTGKSILAPHLAYAVAQGRPVFGLRVKRGRTLYAAAEDISGMRQRVHALKLQHSDAPDFALVECGNLRDPATVEDLCAAVANWKPALLVVDTLGAAFAGMDENSSQDMGEVAALARRLARHDCAVLLVHHTAKQGDGSPRGHSVLNGTLDVCITLAAKDEAGIIRGSLGKNRNGSTDRNLAFRFDAVNLGADDDGDAITAPRAFEVMGQQAAPPKLTPVARKLLEVVGQMQAEGGGQVDETGLRERCDDQRALSAAPDPASRERAYRRAFKECADKAGLSAGNGKIWLKSAVFLDSVDGPDRLGQTRTKADCPIGQSS